MAFSVRLVTTLVDTRAEARATSMIEMEPVSLRMIGLVTGSHCLFLTYLENELKEKKEKRLKQKITIKKVYGFFQAEILFIFFIRYQCLARNDPQNDALPALAGRR